MKYIIVIAAFMFAGLHYSIAQTKNKKNSSRKTTVSTNKTSVKGTNASQKKLRAGTAISGGKVVALHHGAHDYTPGSPVGTGGAGGSTMSGSPQGSASENALGRKPSNELVKKASKSSTGRGRTNNTSKDTARH